MRPLLFIAGLLLTPSAVVAAQVPSLVGPSTCERVELSAATLECQDETCTLLGEARLSCDQVDIRADRIDMTLDHDGSFKAAKATGNVILLDGEKLLRCTSVQLEAGQLTGQIDKALLQVFKRPKDAQEAREPRATERKPGLIRQTVHGDIQRTGRDTFILRDAQFTLCDCGENEIGVQRRRARV